MVEASTVVLFFTFLGLIIALIVILYLYVTYNRRVELEPVPIPIDEYCIGPGREPATSAPIYVRSTPYIVPNEDPMASNDPFPNPNNYRNLVIPSYKTRSLNQVLPTNTWQTAIFYRNQSKEMNIFPYFVNLREKFLDFSWPEAGVVTSTCNLETCEIGEANLLYTANIGPMLSLSTGEDEITANDITDFDILTTRITLSAYNRYTNGTGTLTIPLVRGSPYITALVDNVSVSLTSNFTFTTSSISQMKHIIYTGTNTGYVIYLSRPLTLYTLDKYIYFVRFTGVMRIAYFTNSSHLSLLDTYHNIYPIDATFHLKDYSYEFSTADMNSNTNDLMLWSQVPNLTATNITNTYTQTGNNISPYSLITFKENHIKLKTSHEVPNLEYKKYTNQNLVTVWDNESKRIIGLSPDSLEQSFKLFGSIAQLIEVGNAADLDISSLVSTLSNYLYNLSINPENTLIYDTTWGGIISYDGVYNCVADNNLAFYYNSLSAYGYLMYAYAVILKHTNDDNFINDNRDIMVSLLRQTVNYSIKDTDYSFSRYKDWYLGYSGTSGLNPENASYNMGENLFAYYAAYHLANLLELDSTRHFAKLCYSTELDAINTYFRTYGSDLTINEEFVQGSVTERAQITYSYVATTGQLNEEFPARNASINISLVKPLANLPLKEEWVTNLQPYMLAALNDPNLKPDGIITACVIASVNSGNITNLENIIVNSLKNYPSLGWTYSNCIYWMNVIG